MSHYRFAGGDNGVKDDGIIAPLGETAHYGIRSFGPVQIALENLTIDVTNYTSQSGNVWLAEICAEASSSVSLKQVDVIGGDGCVFADGAYVAIGEGVTVSGFRPTGIVVANVGYVYVGRPVTVDGADGEPGEYSEVVVVYRNGSVMIRRCGSFAMGTDDGSSPDFERYSIEAVDGGTVRVRHDGEVTIDGFIAEFRSGTIRVQTGTLNGAIWIGDQSHLRVENLNHSGGDIDTWHGCGTRIHDSQISVGSTDPIYVGQMSTLRIDGGSIGNVSGIDVIEAYGYGYSTLRDMVDVGNREIIWSDPRSFSCGDAANVGVFGWLFAPQGSPSVRGGGGRHKKDQVKGYGISRLPGPRLQPKSACNTNPVKLTAI